MLFSIDTFYLTHEQLSNSPSRKDGVSEEIEKSQRFYGAELIQEAGILLKLPQAAMATGQVLFHRFYCKKSMAKFNVKRVAASCIWLAAKLEENFRKAKDVIVVFHRMEQRRNDLPIEPFDPFSTVYIDLKRDIIKNERYLLKEMGFVCHVEHPHKFLLSYLQQLEVKDDAVKQEAWSLANDSLRTPLCVRFKSEIVACGVIYIATRRAQIPLPEDPPWWLVFDCEKRQIDQVCEVMADLYSMDKPAYLELGRNSNAIAAKREEKAPSSAEEVVAALEEKTPEIAKEEMPEALGSEGAVEGKGNGAVEVVADPKPIPVEIAPVTAIQDNEQEDGEILGEEVVAPLTESVSAAEGQAEEKEPSGIDVENNSVVLVEEKAVQKSRIEVSKQQLQEREQELREKLLRERARADEKAKPRDAKVDELHSDRAREKESERETVSRKRDRDRDGDDREVRRRDEAKDASESRQGRGTGNELAGRSDSSDRSRRRESDLREKLERMHARGSDRGERPLYEVNRGSGERGRARFDRDGSNRHRYYDRPSGRK